jgi:hypothetical protein
VRLALKVVIGVFAAIGVGYVGLLAYGFLFLPMCTLASTAQATSPDAEYFAVYEHTVCDDPNLSKSHVLIGQRDVKERIVAARVQGTTDVGLTWKGQRELVVSYPVGAEVTKLGPYEGWPRVTLRPRSAEWHKRHLTTPSSARRRDKVLILNQVSCGAHGGRYAALSFVAITLALLCSGVGVAHATPPLPEVVVTPRNAKALNFTVEVNPSNGRWSLRILAPTRVDYASLQSAGQCTVDGSLTELLDHKRSVVYLQSSDLSSTESKVEVAGKFYAPAITLDVSIFYKCSNDAGGVKYLVRLSDWSAMRKAR